MRFLLVLFAIFLILVDGEKRVLDLGLLNLEYPNVSKECENGDFIQYFTTDNDAPWPYLLAALKRCPLPVEEKAKLELLDKVITEIGPGLITKALNASEKVFEKTVRPIWAAFVQYVGEADRSLAEKWQQLTKVMFKDEDKDVGLESIHFRLLLDIYIVLDKPWVLTGPLDEKLTPKALHYLEMVPFTLGKGISPRIKDFIGRLFKAQEKVVEADEYQIGEHRQEFLDRLLQLLGSSEKGQEIFFEYYHRSPSVAFGRKDLDERINRVLLLLPIKYEGPSNGDVGGEENLLNPFIIALAQAHWITKRKATEMLEELYLSIPTGLCNSLNHKDVKQKLAILSSIIPSNAKNERMSIIRSYVEKCAASSEKVEWDKKWADIIPPDDLRNLGPMDELRQVVDKVVGLLAKNEVNNAKKMAEDIKSPQEMAKMYYAFKREHLPQGHEVLLHLKDKYPEAYADSTNSAPFRSLILLLSDMADNRPNFEILSRLCTTLDKKPLCQGLLENSLKDLLFQTTLRKRYDAWASAVQRLYSWVADAHSCNVERLYDCSQTILSLSFTDVMGAVRLIKDDKTAIYRALSPWVSDKLLLNSNNEVLSEFLEMFFLIKSTTALNHMKLILRNPSSDLKFQPGIGDAALLAAILKAIPEDVIPIGTGTSLNIEKLREHQFPTMEDVCLNRCVPTTPNGDLLKTIREIVNKDTIGLEKLNCQPPKTDTDDLGVGDWFAYKICKFVLAIRLDPKVREYFKSKYRFIVKAVLESDVMTQDSSIENLLTGAKGLVPIKEEGDGDSQKSALLKRIREIKKDD